jgi:hypothetical protein
MRALLSTLSPNLSWVPVSKACGGSEGAEKHRVRGRSRIPEPHYPTDSIAVQGTPFVFGVLLEGHVCVLHVNISPMYAADV